MPTTNNKFVNITFDFLKRKLFKVGDLFYILNGKGITAEEIRSFKGSFPAVQSEAENNGILGYIDLSYCKKNYTYELEPCLTVARSGTSVFMVVLL